MKKKETAKGRIAQLEKDFDAIVNDLEITPMTKKQYKAIERELWEVVEYMKGVAEQL